MAALTRSSASLALCQANAIGPVPTDLALRITIEVARALDARHDRAEAAGGSPHHGLSPAHVLVGYDGSVTLADDGDRGRVPVVASYLSPEQVRGDALDRRADVFSLGIVLWELLTGTQLFERDTETATAQAILEDPITEVSAVNPDVPPVIAEVLGAALVRNKKARFDNVAAFGKALGGGRASSGVAEASAEDLARWVAERVPRVGRPAPPRPRPSGAPPRPRVDTAPTPPPRLDLAAAPSPRIELAPAPSPRLDVAPAPPVSPTPHTASNAAATSVEGAVPDLDLPGAPRSHRSPEAPPPAPASVRQAAAAAFADVALSAPQKAIPLDSGSEEDFDMQIERNLMTADLPPASSPSGAKGANPSARLAAARPPGAPRAGSGLELGAQQRSLDREERSERDDEPTVGARIGGFGGALIVLALSSAALFKFVHRTGGRPFTSFLSHAYDGSSANQSGAVAIGSLIVAITLIFVGLRLKPHAWSIVVSGGALLILALAMVTATLASTGDNPTPPDGALLVPYVAPVSIVLLALGIGGRAARILARGRGARRLGGVPLAAIAGALAFVAFEASRLAAGR